VRPLDGAAARLLPGTENASWPFWSPDGKSVGFASYPSALGRVDLAGGMPVQMGEPSLVMRGGSWGADGNIVYATLAGLFRVPASGGKTALLVKPDTPRGEDAYNWPQVLPGGKVLYFVPSANATIRGVYAARLDKLADRVKLLSVDGNAVYAADPKGQGYLLWTRGGELVAQEFNPRTLAFAGDPVPLANLTSSEGRLEVAASANGILLYGATAAVAQLRWVDRTGKLLAELAEPSSAITMFRLSPDERRVAVQYSSAGGSDLWLLDAERGVPSRLTADPGITTQPLWSPDGRTILFTHLGTHALLRKPANGVGEEQVITERPGDSMIPSDWSRDGRWLLTRERDPETKYDIWRIPVTPDGRLRQDEPPARYRRTRFNESQARFSPEPNPRWVAYTSDESGQNEVYIDAFPEPRGQKRISTAGGGSPQWGPGSRELYYVSREDKLMAVDLKLGAETVEPSTPRELFALSLRSSAGPTYQASRDGQRFLVLTNAEVAAQPLTVIVNWPALLKKATAAP
jgi:dipeptidyl aminopeptidase/acylaminoacyl peptidase